jgi:hypothetical protein
MRDRDDMKREGLEQAVDLAIQGKRERLYEILVRGSRMPGPRPNMDLAEELASVCAARGKGAEGLVTTLATLDADVAPGATELEFLPMCGVVAAGARGASDPSSVPRMLRVLEEAAEDLRWRVREAVAPALARIGAVRGEALALEVEPWMDGFFPAATVISALGRQEWLSRLERPEGALSRLEDAFLLVRNAERSAERYPGYKALFVALGASPALLAGRFGALAFDVLARMSDVKEPMVREAIEKSLENPRLARRFASEIARVRGALEASAPVARDPRSNVGPTRRRGRRRRPG